MKIKPRGESEPDPGDGRRRAARQLLVVKDHAQAGRGMGRTWDGSNRGAGTEGEVGGVLDLLWRPLPGASGARARFRPEPTPWLAGRPLVRSSRAGACVQLPTPGSVALTFKILSETTPFFRAQVCPQTGPELQIRAGCELGCVWVAERQTLRKCAWAGGGTTFGCPGLERGGWARGCVEGTAHRQPPYPEAADVWWRAGVS